MAGDGGSASACTSEPPTTTSGHPSGDFTGLSTRLLSAVPVLVGVPSHGELAVGALDLLLVGVPRHAEHLVVVRGAVHRAFNPNGSRRRRLRLSPPVFGNLRSQSELLADSTHAMTCTCAILAAGPQIFPASLSSGVPTHARARHCRSAGAGQDGIARGADRRPRPCRHAPVHRGRRHQPGGWPLLRRGSLRPVPVTRDTAVHRACQRRHARAGMLKRAGLAVPLLTGRPPCLFAPLRFHGVCRCEADGPVAACEPT